MSYAFLIPVLHASFWAGILSRWAGVRRRSWPGGAMTMQLRLCRWCGALMRVIIYPGMASATTCGPCTANIPKRNPEG